MYIKFSYEMKEVNAMEGVARYQVRLLPHNVAWEEEFQQVKNWLERCWQQNVIDIQHVGSTAIKTICAKPILDIAVQLHSIHLMDIPALVQQGYEYRGLQGGNESHHLFVLRSEQGLSLQHIHCYDRNEKGFYQLVGFRDYLNQHLEEAKQYEMLKQKLAENYAENRAAYTKSKEEFIQSIYEKLAEINNFCK